MKPIIFKISPEPKPVKPWVRFPSNDLVKMLCQTKEKTLKESAKESCVARGHRMSNFKRYSVTLFESVCRDCGMYVQVNLKPQANETEISGSAVALNCREKCHK